LLDSNPFDDPVYSAELLAGLASCNIEWFAAATFETAANKKFAKAAAAAGCRGLLVGFKSLNVQSLANIGLPILLLRGFFDQSALNVRTPFCPFVLSGCICLLSASVVYRIAIIGKGNIRRGGVL
jgi:hypothetical protein